MRARSLRARNCSTSFTTTAVSSNARSIGTSTIYAAKSNRSLKIRRTSLRYTALDISSGRTDVRERVLHALDLGMLGDWDGAKRSLENLDDPIVPRLTALLTDQQRRERERAEVQAVARHELGNA